MSDLKKMLTDITEVKHLHSLRKSMKYSHSIFVFVFVISSAASAQDVAQDLSSYFGKIRSGISVEVPKSFTTAKANTILNALTPYFSDSTISVRSAAYALSARVGIASQETLIRETSVKQLVEACKDRDTGITGLALEQLTTFGKKDFSAEAKDSVRSLVKQKIAHFDQLLKLVGFLELTDLKEHIRPYTQAGNPQSVRWAAIISLARMNDVVATQEMMTRARKLQVNDDVVYQVFPGLVYSRQREAIDYAVQIMKSNESNCSSANPDSGERIPCGYRIMEQLAVAIENYPLQLDASGDIKTKDYKKALETVRNWFAKNAKTYRINRDKY